MIDHLLAFLFPERCISCNSANAALCDKCIAHIPLSTGIVDIPNAFALYDYGDPTIRKAVWELKYHHKSGAMKTLAKHGSSRISDYINSINKNGMPVVLVPVPQHYVKTFSRGFNQSRLIAQWIKKSVGEPFSVSMLPLLKKVRGTESQAHMHSRAERQKNLNNSIVVNKKYTIDPNALYIVVDDVITTGSTVNETSRALRAAGARHVYAMALAHGYARA
jgi:ComF family protein